MRDWRRISVCGLDFDPFDESALVDQICAALDLGVGGWATIPDGEVLSRALGQRAVRQGLAAADRVIASGAGLRLASWIEGSRLPVCCGAAFIWALLSGLRLAGRRVYLLGGSQDGPGARDRAHRAASALLIACPGVTIVGYASPRLGGPEETDDLEAACREIVQSGPDVVIVGMDVARQAWLAACLRPAAPGTWFIGWRGAIDMMAGLSARSSARSARSLLSVADLTATVRLGWHAIAGQLAAHRTVRTDRTVGVHRMDPRADPCTDSRTDRTDSRTDRTDPRVGEIRNRAS